MGQRLLLFAGSIFIVGVALLLGTASRSPSERPPPIIGKNNTALFLVNSEPGLSNVHAATAQALLERHPHIQVHFASFAPLAPKVQRISSYAKKTFNSNEIKFHLVDAITYFEAISATGKIASEIKHPPGFAGIGAVCRDIQSYLAPWTAETFLDIYEKLQRIIRDVDPAVVVLDSMFRPAVDATRDLNRLHAVISPNTLIDSFQADQPWAPMIWKYPALGSGIPFPVPWSRLIENIYLNTRYMYSMILMPDIKSKQAFLRSKGIENPIEFFGIRSPDAPWITQTLPGASIPVDVIPPNVTCTGPMTLSLGSAAEQDPVLAAWLARAPTVLINLGSAFTYTEEQAAMMAKALAEVLSSTQVQVIWKFRKLTDAVGRDDKTIYSDDFKKPLQPFIDNNRVKIVTWVSVDPTALLESGHIVTSVHHGGSGCYHEALSAGVPHVILPQWLDLYNFAQLSENVGIGVWGCRKTSPKWTSECLRDAILKAADGGDDSLKMRKKARQLAEITQSNPGKYISAREIAKLAGSGN
ncbi:hypothetical protein GGS23DRAFT_421379 [Durotheca rogersii]|uniref:uncharacterized protein n=1 Tax=Durotheca rogersii TaxID=419775 RepID=UPI00221F0342|nr:uncharacterized protein GGS23DRAFT_421379 [Durotheca rogersii]KAI5865313.1 hypothetical protein GGS23DRAFT_421379 [Durotheca rogersii]